MSVFVKTAKNATPIELVRQDAAAAWLKKQPVAARNWIGQGLKEPKAGQYFVLPGKDGMPERVIAVVGNPATTFDIASLSKALPEGAYKLESSGLKADELQELALGYGLGAYDYTRYKKAKRAAATLVLPKEVDAKRVESLVAAQNMARDLINTPAEDMGPPELAAAATKMAKELGAQIKVISGAALNKGFPLVAAVGRAGPKPAQLIDLTWGKASAPKLTLVGKGVCFDTGGLNIKTRAMGAMKKDMGGAATLLAVARMIIETKINVRLRLIIPAVENSVGSNSIRPSDVVKSRAGITVEIQDTDAEGRLILADALALAAEDKPDLIVDAATLTGAKYGLLGGEIGAIYTNKPELAQELQQIGMTIADPLWHAPMWEPYLSRLDSIVADTMSCAEGGGGDSPLAAMFLQKFVGKGNWLHLDVNCDNEKSRPGRPAGGEAQAARALFTLISRKYKG